MKHIGFKRQFTGAEIIEANEKFMLACDELEMACPEDKAIKEGIKLLRPFFRTNLSFFVPKDKYILTLREAEDCFVIPKRSMPDIRLHLESTLRTFRTTLESATSAGEPKPSARWTEAMARLSYGTGSDDLN